MDAFGLVLAALILLNGCMNMNAPSESKHLVCDAGHSELDALEIISQFPKNYREIQWSINNSTFVSEGFVKASKNSEKVNSKQLQFVQYEASLPSGPIESISKFVNQEVAFPCDECSMQVVSQSPDMKWIIVDIKSMGIWILGSETSKRVWPNTPNSYHFTWAADSSAVWMTYNKGETGLNYLLVKDIDSDIEVMQLEELENFPSDLIGDEHFHLFYNAVFSPKSQKVWFYPVFPSEKTYIYDTTLESYVIEEIDNFIGVEWQPAIGKLMIRKFDNHSLTMNAVDGSYSVEIAGEVLTDLYLTPSEDQENLIPYIKRSRTYLPIDENSFYVRRSPSQISIIECEEVDSH